MCGTDYLEEIGKPVQGAKGVTAHIHVNTVPSIARNSDEGVTTTGNKLSALSAYA